MSAGPAGVSSRATVPGHTAGGSATWLQGDLATRGAFHQTQRYERGTFLFNVTGAELDFPLISTFFFKVTLPRVVSPAR